MRRLDGPRPRNTTPRSIPAQQDVTAEKKVLLTELKIPDPHTTHREDTPPLSMLAPNLITPMPFPGPDEAPRLKKQSAAPQCKFYQTLQGCRFGKFCHFKHAGDLSQQLAPSMKSN